MHVEDGVYVIDLYVKDLIDSGGPVFLRGVASEGDERSCETVNRSGGTRRA